MKKVYCLYRVSTKGQVDKDDIPMQKQACHEFAQKNGWNILKEFSEKGVSGFKVSADDRGAIQDLKLAAEKKEFDVLLVFMFDRLGRRQDETPFVVEWFVKQGVEVWSTQEGQQCFENDVDSLMNFIRYWQAGGESRKTSTRVKTRLSQLTADGVYTGGVTPYGYKLIKSGRFSKKGKELMDIVKDEEQAPIIELIFNKTVKEGYGSFRIANLLNQEGLRTHNGSKFQCNTINRILHNRIYCGYFVSGNTTSPFIERLCIIDESTFELAQFILEQRSKTNSDKQQIALNTKGHTLLSGNLYCAHCGGKLLATSYVDSHKRADGTEYRVRRQRYICCNNARNRGECDGQSAYVSKKIDAAVTNVLLEYFNRIKNTPRSVALEKRYTKELERLKLSRKSLTREIEKQKKCIVELSSEIAKALMGDSKFTPDMLSVAIANSNQLVREKETELTEVENALNNQDARIKKLDFFYEQFQTWATEFENATLEQKKMIVCQLIKEISVHKGYELDIVFSMNYEQFLAS